MEICVRPILWGNGIPPSDITLAWKYLSLAIVGFDKGNITHSGHIRFPLSEVDTHFMEYTMYRHACHLVQRTETT